MDIGPIKAKVAEIKFKQSKSEVLPGLPLRALALGNSGNGKTNLIANLIVDERFYRNAFAKVYWLSPTATIDDALEPVSEYIDTHIDQDQEEDPSFHETSQKAPQKHSRNTSEASQKHLRSTTETQQKHNRNTQKLSGEGWWGGY